MLLPSAGSQNIYFQLAEGESTINSLFKCPGTETYSFFLLHSIGDKWSPNRTWIQKVLSSNVPSLVSHYTRNRTHFVCVCAQLVFTATIQLIYPITHFKNLFITGHYTRFVRHLEMNCSCLQGI